MSLPSEAAQLCEEALALVQKLDGKNELSNLQLHTMVTSREQFHLPWGIIAMRIQRSKSTVKSADK
jgi:hypothetical protein